MAVQEVPLSELQARYADDSEHNMAATQVPSVKKAEAGSSASGAEDYDEDEYWEDEDEDESDQENASHLGRLAGELHQSKPAL